MFSRCISKMHERKENLHKKAKNKRIPIFCTYLWLKCLIGFINAQTTTIFTYEFSTV